MRYYLSFVLSVFLPSSDIFDAMFTVKAETSEVIIKQG